MLRPVLTSVGLHVVIVLIFTISWPFFDSDNALTAQPLMIVDMVATVPTTNLPDTNVAKADKQNKSAPASAPPTPPPPSRPKQVAVKKVAVVKVAVKKIVAKDVEILPDLSSKVDIPLPKPKLDKVAIAVPKSRPKLPKKPVVPIAKPKSKSKSKPKPTADPDAAKKLQERVNKLNKLNKQKKQAALDMARSAVLQNLAKMSAKSAADAPKRKKANDQKQAEAEIATALDRAAQTSEPSRPEKIGQSEIDKLSAHIAKFWFLPGGAANEGAGKLKVKVRIVRPQRDGTVDTVEVVDRQRYKTDNAFRVAADAARRAVLKASPLPLPAEKYDQWKEYIIFVFDPSFISGG